MNFLMELNEKQFIAGFNSGYILAEFEPQLLTALLKEIRPVNSYIYGLSFGQKEYELLQSEVHLNELNRLRQKTSKDKTRL
ncbi:MAG: hypothetical protein IPI45_07190 [Saprospiraceae bacterium]|nr:hypothetical protein [Saprospiraceae bacterium]